MTDATGSMQSPERPRAHAIAALVPFFHEASESGDAAARRAADALLSSCNAVTPKELQLATQVMALTWASLVCLGAAASVRDTSIEDMVDLRDSGLAMNALSVTFYGALTARQNDRVKNPGALTPENMRWDEGTFQLSINRALDKYNDAIARKAAAREKARLPAPKTQPPALARRWRLN